MRLIPHDDDKNVTKTSALAKERDLNFYAENLQMVNGTVKKVKSSLLVVSFSF